MHGLGRASCRSEGRWLLVCDVDDTLLGEDESLDLLARILRRSPRVLLVLNSSRPWASVRQSLADQEVVLPHVATICAMGTHVRIGGASAATWSGRFAGWDRGVIDRLMEARGFEGHRPEFQTAHKASFSVPRREWDRMIAAVQACGMPVRIVTSGTSDFDVLPEGAGKGNATIFLLDHLGLSRDRLIVAGDSRNDLGMFEIADRGIVVGNARRELRRGVDPARVYVASRGHAGGVLEGLRHYAVVCGDGTSPGGRGDWALEGVGS